MKFKKIFFVIIILLSTMPGLCFGVNVTAHVDKSKISQEDSVFLKIEVNGGKADLDLSVIKDFKVIPRGTSSSFNYINGKLEKKADYQFVLLPLSKGNLKIPAIKATIKGKTVFTKEIIIHVADQIVEPNKVEPNKVKPNKVKSNNVKALFAKSFVTKDQVFTGEQVVFTLQFFTSKRLSGNVLFEKSPEFKGFTAKSFEEEKSYTQIINGVRFNVIQIDYIITPSNPGMFTIDPAVLIAKVVVRSNFNDPFFFSDRSKPVRVVSNPVEIKVLPLPQYQNFKNQNFKNQGLKNQGLKNLEDNKFTGLVGNFNIESNINKTDLKTGESATLTIKISGTGNIMDASLPEMDFDNNLFKIYDDNPVETIELTQNGYKGFKIFKKALVPVSPGKFEIKPVSLIYFDVQKKDYNLVSTKPISIEVSLSQKTEFAVKSQNSPKDKSIVKKEVSLVNKDILEIKEGLKVLKNYKSINFLLFVVLLSTPAILFLGVKFFTIVNKKELSIEKQMMEKAKIHFKKAIKLNKQGDDFLRHLYSSVVSSILAKGHKKGETITIKEAQIILKNAGVDNKKSDQITSLLENIESVRFSEKILDENRAKDLLSKTKQTIKMICLGIVCLSISIFTPQKAMADSTETFIEAVKEYKAGDFINAAQKFESIAQNSIKNPYLYYNIGNAYLKAKERGHAILWYERAKLILPNDPDLNFNLDYANSLIKDKKDDSIDMMEILFFWDSLISVKTVQITAILFSFLFFIWAGIQALRGQKVFSGTGIVLCLLLILTTTVTCINYYKISARLNAVIVIGQAFVRSGTTEQSTQLFTLHEGTKTRVVEKRDGYLKIKFSKGKIGWIKADQAVII